ncbi:MAG: hypothetical protein ABIQ86_16165 [Steroidobacteraceae bacterium]
MRRRVQQPHLILDLQCQFPAAALREQIPAEKRARGLIHHQSAFLRSDAEARDLMQDVLLL